MSSARQRGRFLVLDGIDGCGKTTQALRLAEHLRGSTGREVLHLREPGGSALGEALRELLLDRRHAPGAEVETLLFAAARRQLLDELVAPALERGSHVVCERFHPSTFAYQAFAGELGEERVLNLLHDWAGEPVPDLVLVLDLELEEALRRRGPARDRIEDRGEAYLARVAAGYRRYAQLDPRARTVPAGGGPDEVALRIEREVRRVL